MDANINELIYLFHMNDEQALSDLVDAFRPMVKKLFSLQPVWRPEHDLVDFQAEANIILLKCLNRYRQDLPTPFSTFYYSSLRHYSLDEAKWILRRFRWDNVSLDWTDENGEMCLSERIGDMRSLTEKRVMCRCVMEDVEDLAEKLYKPQEREVIRLHMAEYSNVEIARKLDIPTWKVRYLLNRLKTEAVKRGLFDVN